LFGTEILRPFFGIFHHHMPIKTKAQFARYIAATGSAIAANTKAH
jgi:hypothetical protein